MPIKRRTPAKRPARTSRADVAPSAPPRLPMSRVVSPDEKRQLILQHAASRRTLDPVQRMSMWAGVVICMAFIIGGWMYTVGSGIKHSLAGTVDPNLQQVVDQSQKFAEETGSQTSDLTQQLQNVSNRVQTMTQQQAMLNVMVQQMATSTATTTPPVRADLFAPHQPTSRTTSTISTSTTTTTP